MLCLANLMHILLIALVVRQGQRDLRLAVQIQSIFYHIE